MAKCGDPNWDWVLNGMCCDKSTKTPVILAGGTTILCCPSGHDCSLINIITCDLALQNPHPVGRDPPVVATIYTDKKLATCSAGCCPWGYTCSIGNPEYESKGPVCIMNMNQSIQPDGKPFTYLPLTGTGTSTSTTTSFTTSSISTSTLSSTLETVITSTADSSPSTVQPVVTNGASSPALSVPSIAGIAAGGFALLLILAGALYFLRRRRRKTYNAVATGDNSHLPPPPPPQPTSTDVKTGTGDNGADNSTSMSMTNDMSVSELPAVDRPAELGNTQTVRPPPGGVFELA